MILNLFPTSRITILWIVWRWLLTRELSLFQSQPRPLIIPYGQEVLVLNWQVRWCSSTNCSGPLAGLPYARFQRRSNELLVKSSSAELRTSIIGLKQMERLLIRGLQLPQILCALPQDIMGCNMCHLQKEHTRKLRRPSLTSSMSVSFEILSSLERQKKDNINLFLAFTEL
jgi:hypothetical protein